MTIDDTREQMTLWLCMVIGAIAQAAFTLWAVAHQHFLAAAVGAVLAASSYYVADRMAQQWADGEGE